MAYTITCRIEIDAGHRVMTHGSKCCHLHGHRYAIEATCAAVGLHENEEQTDMVLDFGFLKEEMLNTISVSCDHGLIVALADKVLLALLAPLGQPPGVWRQALAAIIREQGFCSTTEDRLGTRLYVVPFQPTAERLARHWFERLAPAVASRSKGIAVLIAVSVWETPNSRADYRISD